MTRNTRSQRLLISLALGSVVAGAACEASDAKPAAAEGAAATPSPAASPAGTGPTEALKALQVANPLVGQPAPDFTAVDQAGQEHKLADYKGKVVVLEWTEPGCPYVKRHYQAGTMQKLVKKYQGADVVWLGVNSAHFVTAEETVAWMKERAVTHPTLIDAAGTVGRAYGAKTTPNMFVIGKDGVLAYAGAIDDDPAGDKETPTNLVELAVDALLRGEQPPVNATRPYG